MKLHEALMNTNEKIESKEKIIVGLNKFQSEEKNSFVNAAATAGTIPYELMVKLAESVRREVV